jgi:N-acetylneuraminic acid mutarotase
MLLRHESWLYRLGGRDETGLTTARALMVQIDAYGPLAAWSDTASLPLGIRSGAAFSAGDFVYVLGGETENGLISTIYYTHIESDGALGFGTDKYWEINLQSLPEARAYAACVLFDGWIFLIGGKTPSGSTNSIIRARIYQDGQVGQWYASSQSLPEARWGAASAVLNDRLYVAGGARANAVTNGVVSYLLGEYGALSDMRIEPDLPIALQQAILLTDRNDLILAGGHDAEDWSPTVYRYHEGSWSATALAAIAEGPVFARAAGALFYMRRIGVNGTDPVKLDELHLAPETPIVVPGSGMVPNNSLIHVNGEQGVTLRYTGIAGNTVTPADAMWPEQSIKISSATLPSMELSLAGFSAEGSASPSPHREYRVRAGKLFVLIDETLQIHGSGYASLDPHVLQESAWFRAIIDVPGHYRLAWADGDEDPKYSARLVLSVYEADLYTEVPDVSENASRDLRGGIAAPLQVALNTGNYYIHIRSLDNAAGGNFGLSLLQE